MGELFEVPYEQQLEEMKRLLVLLMASVGRSRAEFTWSQQAQVPMDATIMTWRDRMNDALVLEVHGWNACQIEIRPRRDAVPAGSGDD